MQTFEHEFHVLAIDPPALAAGWFDKQTKAAALGTGFDVAGNVAVINIYGTVDERGGRDSSIAGMVQRAASDNSVSSIVLNVDSPGGYAQGVHESAQIIRQAASTKPVVAVANFFAASAAYWLASAASKFYASPTAEVGSVGVVAMHADMSKMLSDAGIKVTFISAGRYKVEGNSFEPLTDEARAYIQNRVDDMYKMFVGDIALYRGVSVTTVKSDFGHGRMLSAQTAKSVGMIDGVKTLDQVVSELKSKPARKGFTRAEVQKRAVWLWY